LDDRNFRVLKTLSEQIRLGINNFDKMMDNAADSGITETRLQDYLSNLAPQLEVPKNEETESIIGKGGDGGYGDPPRIAVVADEGTHFLYMAFQHAVQRGNASKKRKQVRYATRTDLDKLIGKLLPPRNRNPFAVVLVVQENGTVIFQDSSPGIEVARIDAFEDESAATKGKKPEDAGRGKFELQKKLSESSDYAEVTLAGARYRLYSQPLQLSFPPLDPGRKSAKTDASPALAEKWALCGLVRADAFRSESQSISYTYMLWLSAGILLAVAAYPFLKLYLSSPIERLHAGEVVTIAVSACVVAAALTFILLDLYYWRYHFDQSAVADMKTLAEAIDTNFGNEQKKAIDQLQNFYSTRLHLALRASQLRTSRLPLLTASGGCSPREACRVRILKDSRDSKVEQYPYMQAASWSDFDGNQQVKWTTKDRVTPFISLKSQSYYPDVKSAFTDVKRAFADAKRATTHPGSPTSAPSQGIGSEYSPNTGENITIFWKLFDMDGNVVPGKVPEDPKDVFCASLVTRPISVFDPVLSHGFQFAVIKSDGTVVFHSDRSRNLRENFLDETDQNQEVRSRVLMRASGPLVANYMGVPHRLYILPMNSSGEQSWTVVVFRDLHPEDTMNLEILSLASIMFLLYAAAMALGMFLAHCTRTRRISGTCLWPDSRKTSTYRWLAIGNGVAALLLLVLCQLPAFLALLFCGIVIPAGAIACNLLLLRRQDDSPSRQGAGGTDITMSSHWQLHYVGTCATLLAVVAVLPCLCFAKVACDFEYKLVVASDQLHLASDLDARATDIRVGYQAVELGQHAKTLLVAPGDPSAGLEKLPFEAQGITEPFFSYHQFLRTSVNYSAEDDSKQLNPPPCGLGSGDDRQRCVDLFLSWSSPAYDQLAADNRYLAETGLAGAQSWSSTPSGPERTLELTNREAGNKVRRIAFLWNPLHIPWNDWHWWLGTIGLMAAVFGFVRWSLRKIFLLDLAAPFPPKNLETRCDPSSLIAKLSMNLLVIGPKSSATIVGLIEREEVQAWDMQDVLNVAQHSAKTADGISFVLSSTGDQVDEIIRDGRPLVLYNCEATFDTPRTNRQSFKALERVLLNLGNRVVITTMEDPSSKAPATGESEPWTSLLQSFVRIDLNSSSPEEGESDEQFETRISAEAYQRWLFPGRSRLQKLALVHLAQERLVSPNSRGAVCELMREGVVEWTWGLFTIKDSRFAEFVKSAVPPATIKHWEEQGAGARSASLRTSLLVVGAGVAAFLIYTQGQVFNTWVTYATGLAASVPAFMKVFAMLRGKSGAEA